MALTVGTADEVNAKELDMKVNVSVRPRRGGMDTAVTNCNTFSILFVDRKPN